MRRLTRRSLVFAVAMLIASSASAAPVNLIANGDFSSGNVGFVTDYVYAPGGDGGWPEGVYSIEKDAASWNHLLVTTGDYTTGAGAMLVANGIDTVGQNTVWETTVSGLTRDTNYYFEASLMNLCCSTLTRPGPQLSFYANGVRVGIGLTEFPGVWTGVSTMWDSAGADSVTLALRNDSAVFSGNDFALDNLYLGVQPVVTPEPASMVLLGTALLLSTARLRRLRGIRQDDSTRARP